MAVGKHVTLSGTDKRAVPTRTPRGSIRTALALRNVWPWTLFIFLAGALNIASLVANGVDLFTAASAQGIAVYATQILLLGLGETLVIVCGGIDLSSGWILGLSSIIAADIMKFMAGLGYGPVESTLLGLAGAALAAAVPGLINGILVARRIPAFVATLAVGFAAQGVAFMRSSGYPLSDRPPYLGDSAGNLLVNWMSTGALASDVMELQQIIPILVVGSAGVAATILCWFLLARTQFGRHLYAIGGNREAARRAGIPLTRTLVSAYVVSALLAGIAGAFWAARTTGGAFYGGETVQIMSIAAVVVGGASLFGGEGTIAGTIAGALVMATIQYGLVMLGVKDYYLYFAVGAVFALAVFVSQLGRKSGK